MRDDCETVCTSKQILPYQRNLWFQLGHLRSSKVTYCYGFASVVVHPEIRYLLLIYQYTAQWLLLYLGNMMLLSYVTVHFYLFYDGDVDIRILALRKRSRCRVSDTQVTVNACGPLVLNWSQLKAQVHVLSFTAYLLHRCVCI